MKTKLIEFDEPETLLMNNLGLPSNLDEIVALKHDRQCEIFDAIENEMLESGYDSDGLNEYGILCRLALCDLGNRMNQQKLIKADKSEFEFPHVQR